MSNIMDIIAEKTNGKSYKTYKYCFDNYDVPSFNYDDHAEITWSKYGETAPPMTPETQDMKSYADRIVSEKPLFTYFLDGSRHTYKVDDIAYNNQVYPVIAGQIGISCCARINRNMQRHAFKSRLVVALPQCACADTWRRENFFNNIKNNVNENATRLKKINLEITDVLSYSTKRDEFEKIESKGIAVIQDLMIDQEIQMVTELVNAGLLDQDNYLLKDGSLEYRVDKIENARERRRFQSNFRNVVGVSKSFNPENCKDKKGKNNSNMIANLPLFHRTPVSLYTSPRLEGMAYAVWYLRIRDKKYTTNTFDGILKIEKIMVTDEQKERGIDTDEVNLISANLINERNPVCYGADTRWANHLYPVYVTERFAKSRYLSTAMFLNLF